jgi:hypothetical protein
LFNGPAKGADKTKPVRVAAARTIENFMVKEKTELCNWRRIIQNLGRWEFNHVYLRKYDLASPFV